MIVGMEIQVDNLEDLCRLMCDNELPNEKQTKLEQNKDKEEKNEYYRHYTGN